VSFSATYKGSRALCICLLLFLILHATADFSLDDEHNVHCISLNHGVKVHSELSMGVGDQVVSVDGLSSFNQYLMAQRYNETTEWKLCIHVGETSGNRLIQPVSVDDRKQRQPGLSSEIFKPSSDVFLSLEILHSSEKFHSASMSPRLWILQFPLCCCVLHCLLECLKR
jgi:hypothetical protein